MIAASHKRLSLLNKERIKYYFLLENGARKSFAFQFEPFNPDQPEKYMTELPEWTLLAHHKCPNCLFQDGERLYCPLAVNLVEIIKRFDGLLSYEKIYLKVVTEEREVSRRTTVQHGMSSLMGIASAVSGCPHTSFFGAMAHFHMPVASIRETVYRAVSSYLLAQYYLKKEGKPADLELEGLTDIYKNLQQVNISIANRLRSVTESDSTVNAIILLDTFAQALPIVMDTALEEIKDMYAPYFASIARLAYRALDTDREEVPSSNKKTNKSAFETG